MYIIIFVILGLFVGSFLNVCMDRLPHRKSIVFPASHCESCDHKLGTKDLIPVFSYLFLKGRCRYCKTGISRRIPIVEFVTAILFGFFYWQFGFTLELPIFLVYGSLFVVIFVIDLEHQLVLNKIVYPSIIFAFIVSFFRPEIAGLDSLGSGAIFNGMSSFAGDAVGQASLALTGGLLGLLVMALPYFVYQGGMGMGDIKLAALIGMITGYPLIILTILLSWILGGLIAAILLILKIKGRKDPIPAAVFTVVAALITLLWGQDIWAWYF